MSLFLTNIEQVMDSNIKVIEKANLKKEELYTLIKTSKPNKIFLNINKEIQLAEISNEEVHFQTCKEVSNRLTIYELLVLSETNNHLIIRNDEKYIGYINPVNLSKQLVNMNDKMKAFFQTILDTIDSSCTVIDAEENVLIWTDVTVK